MANPLLKPEDYEMFRKIAADRATRAARYCDLLPDLFAMGDDSFGCAVLARAIAELEKATEAVGPLKQRLSALAEEASEKARKFKPSAKGF